MTNGDHAQQLPAMAEDTLSERFPDHPFARGLHAGNAEYVLANYLTMSLAFPYLQAGCQLRVLRHHIHNKQDLPRSAEVTAVVGAFLTWDETGGHNAVLRHGNAGLPKILNTERFHANLLRSDLEKIFGRPIRPAFTDVTQQYLDSLYYGLSDIDPVDRVAHMVAFESHAANMIEALWKSLVDLYGLKKEELVYFLVHVGGDDPAEAYHVEMTNKMIAEVIQPSDGNRFLDSVASAYELSSEWCKSLTEYDQGRVE